MRRGIPYIGAAILLLSAEASGKTCGWLEVRSKSTLELSPALTLTPEIVYFTDFIGQCKLTHQFMWTFYKTESIQFLVFTLNLNFGKKFLFPNLVTDNWSIIIDRSVNILKIHWTFVTEFVTFPFHMKINVNNKWILIWLFIFLKSIARGVQPVQISMTKWSRGEKFIIIKNNVNLWYFMAFCQSFSSKNILHI